MAPPRAIPPPSHRRLRPDQIPILRTLDSIPWKNGIISLGSDNKFKFYRFLIIHDVEQAKQLLPFPFTSESHYGDTVIRVNDYTEELRKHGPGLGLKLAYKSYFLFMQELVIEGVSDDTLPTGSSLRSSIAPPAYEDALENAADDSDPPPYDSEDESSKRSDSKTAAKKI